MVETTDMTIPVAQAPVSHEWGARPGAPGGRTGDRDDLGGSGAG